MCSRGFLEVSLVLFLFRLSRRKHMIWVSTSSSIQVFTNEHLAENTLLNPLKWGFKLPLHQKKKTMLRLLKFWVAKSGISFSRSCFNSNVLTNWTFFSFLSTFFQFASRTLYSFSSSPYLMVVFCLFVFFFSVIFSGFLGGKFLTMEWPTARIWCIFKAVYIHSFSDRNLLLDFIYYLENDNTSVYIFSLKPCSDYKLIAWQLLGKYY